MRKSYPIEDDKQKFRVVLSEWFESGIPRDLKERSIVPNKMPKNIAFVLCGVRRSGKTYLLFEFAQKLRKKNYLYNVIYLNLEDIRLHPLTPSLLLLVPEVIEEYFDYKKNVPFWFIFDEIQYLEGWERIIRNYLDRNLGFVLLTGSSSAVSPDGIAGSMRGRTLTKFIYPLSFSEFLKFKGFKIPPKPDTVTSRKKANLLKLGREYLEFGGFPGIVLCEEKSLKKPMLREIYRTIFFRDIVERFSIRNLDLMETYMKILTEQFSSKFSISKIHAFLTKTLGMRITKNTLQEYLHYIKSAFIVFEVEIFSYKLKDRLQYPRKLYLIDTGLANAINIRFTENLGRLLENVVFLELKREEKEIFYWKSKNGEEVDFVIVENFKPVEVIQVCWELKEENIKREEKALIKCMKEFSLKEGKVITWDYEEKKKIDDKWIIYVPFWKWCLKKE
jgi:hypothetical protein